MHHKAHHLSNPRRKVWLSVIAGGWAVYMLQLDAISNAFGNKSSVILFTSPHKQDAELYLKSYVAESERLLTQPK